MKSYIQSGHIDLFIDIPNNKYHGLNDKKEKCMKILIFTLR